MQQLLKKIYYLLTSIPVLYLLSETNLESKELNAGIGSDSVEEQIKNALLQKYDTKLEKLAKVVRITNFDALMSSRNQERLFQI